VLQTSYDSSYYISKNNPWHTPVFNGQSLQTSGLVIASHATQRPSQDVNSSCTSPGTSSKAHKRQLTRYDQLEAQKILLEQRLRELQEQRSNLVQNKLDPERTLAQGQQTEAYPSKCRPIPDHPSSSPSQIKDPIILRSDVRSRGKKDLPISHPVLTKSQPHFNLTSQGRIHKRNSSRETSSDGYKQESVALYSHKPLPLPPPINTKEAPTSPPSERNLRPVNTQTVNRKFPNTFSSERHQEACQLIDLHDESLLREEVDEEDILGWVDDLKFASTGPPGQGLRLPPPRPVRADSDISTISSKSSSDYTCNLEKPKYEGPMGQDYLFVQNTQTQKRNFEIQSTSRDRKMTKDRLISASLVSGTFEMFM